LSTKAMNSQHQTLQQRHAAEETFHDRKSASRHGNSFYEHGATLHAFQKFLDVAGDLKGLAVLDLGCGTGWASILYAQNGANVTAIDISEGSLRIARDHASLQGLHIDFIKGAAEDMNYHEAFDRVLGISVLHHTDLKTSAPSIHRALKPGGKAIFMEPLAHNPILNLYRKLTPGRRSRDETPLTIDSINTLSAMFRSAEIHGYGLLSLFAFVFIPVGAYNAFRRASRLLSYAENRVLSAFPFLHKYCWGAVLHLTK
jgi:ubiquinone/menaquinone biosynthesis C-methylase UbiE